MPGRSDLNKVLWGFNTQTIEISKSRRKSCSCTFWVAILLVTVAIFVYQIYKDIKLLLDNPVTTSMQQRFDEELNFPNVTICAREPVELGVYRSLGGMTEEEMGYIASALTIYPPALDQYQNVNTTAMENVFKRKMKVEENITGEMLLEYIGNVTDMTVENMIVNCSVRGKTENCTEMFGRSGYYETDFCFFNTHIAKQTGAGYRGAMKLVLSSEVIIRSGIDNERPYGWKLWLRPENGTNTGVMSPISIMKGATTDIKLSKLTRTRVSYRHRGCTLSPKTHDQCIHECEANATGKDCGCVRIGTNANPKSLPLCCPGTQGLCAYHASRNVRCKCDQIACHTTDFYGDAMLINVPTSGNENTTIITLYYDTLETTHYTETFVVSVSSVLGTIGGQASLWLGIRFANVVQVIYYAYWALRSARNHEPTGSVA